jgi:hypothetical protein
MKEKHMQACEFVALLALVEAESREALFELRMATHPDDPEFVA